MSMFLALFFTSLHVQDDMFVSDIKSLFTFPLCSTVLPPPQLSASSPSNESITVSWAPVTHAVQYSLTVYKLGSSSDMKLNTVNTSITVTGLDAGSLYVISGFAWDMEGRQGEKSLYINQTTRKGQFSLLFLNVPNVGTVNNREELKHEFSYIL